MTGWQCLCSSLAEPAGGQDSKPVCLTLPAFKAVRIQEDKVVGTLPLVVSGVWNLLTKTWSSK